MGGLKGCLASRRVIVFADCSDRALERSLEKRHRHWFKTWK